MATNAVARKAGDSSGSLYESFPNRQAILDAIVDRRLAEGRRCGRRVRCRGADDLGRPAPVDVMSREVQKVLMLYLAV